ncbi:hypothetical protein LARV_00847 [Longilinea arvoryzae]|uniref:Molybdopterin cofactor biosynthesis MoaD-related C-terminal domain-containing protein n=1 Tax=Longilinea arvoryzae TaxID=360412 RepID=A0A0S7BH08_9CHLR|nr:DUF1952 domain-containing protein [Longilinea arvoryzae]GAP13105.1 hypothetical protein LARV_00847 [Longilinea arvoryzae]
MVLENRELRALPLWLMRDYLLELGGVEKPDGSIEGDGWQARLTQLEDFSIGSLKVGQIRLEWQAEEAANARVWPILEKKLLRAGG